MSKKVVLDIAEEGFTVYNFDKSRSKKVTRRVVISKETSGAYYEVYINWDGYGRTKTFDSYLQAVDFVSSAEPDNMLFVSTEEITGGGRWSCD